MSEPLFDQLARVREAWSAFVQAVWAERTYLLIAMGLVWRLRLQRWCAAARLDSS